LGVLKDVYDPSERTFNFSRINHLDYREWLAGLGAGADVTHSTLVRYIYVSTFSNLAGNDTGGSMAAGTVLEAMMLGMGYQGSFAWRFHAGTGDTMVAPLYQVLRHRGV